VSTIITPGQIAGHDLPLFTSLRNRIPNDQLAEISAYERNLFADIAQDFGARAEFRGFASPTYNCHGLVFASRRTAIHDSAAISMILHDDGFEPIAQSATLPGDVVIYFSDNGDAQHSGIVIGKPTAPFMIPLVLSKWGKFSEVLHLSTVCPYDLVDIRYFRVERCRL